MVITHLSGRHFELVVVKLQRRRRDVNAEECRRISVMNPDRRIQRQHIRRHPRPVAPRLDIKILEHNTLQKKKLITPSVNSVEHQVKKKKKTEPLP